MGTLIDPHRPSQPPGAAWVRFLMILLSIAAALASGGCASDGADPTADTYGNESAAEALEEEEQEDAWRDANR